MKNKWASESYFTPPIRDSFNLAFVNMGTHQIKSLRDTVTEERLAQSKPFTKEETGLATPLLNSLMLNFNQESFEAENQHAKRIKAISGQLTKLCLETIRSRQKIIDSITTNSDRITKLVMLLINPSPLIGLPPPKTIRPITADCGSLTSLNRLLQDRLVRLNLKGLELAERFQTSYFAVFGDSDFSDYIDRTKHAYIEQFHCVHKSLKALDHLRIHNELFYKNNQKRRDEIYTEIIDGFKIYKKELTLIKNTLKKLGNPDYAELKEFIISNGFAINTKTGANILLGPKRDFVFKKIKTIEKRLSQRKTRLADSQVQKNLIVYNFRETPLNPCDFMKEKTKTINKLIDEFLVNKNAAEIISSRKDFESKENTRQVTVRMPQPTITKITRLAKKNNISEQLLLNIIIQHSSESILSSGKAYYAEKQKKKEEEKVIKDFLAKAAGTALPLPF